MLYKLYKNEKLFILLFFTTIAFIFTLPIFHNFNYWGILDWDGDLFKHDVSRITILKYHQFPLWNPYYCGGIPLLAHPETSFLSPSFLLILFFGAVKGIKLSIWIHLVIGMVGMYKLSRHYKLDRLAALLPVFVYMLSSMYSLFSTGGATEFLTIAYIPWAFLFYLKGFRNLKFAFLSGLVLVLIFFEGGVQILIILFLFIVFYSVISIKTYGIVKIIKTLSITSFIAICLGAIQLFPALDFMKNYMHHFDYGYSGYSLRVLWHSLLNRNQLFSAFRNFEQKKGFIDGMSFNWGENGMYIGPIPLLLFLIGFILHWKRRWQLAICFLIFLWLGFGNRAPFSLWELLHFVPAYYTMQVAQRFRFIFMLCLAIFVGFGFQAVKNYISRRLTNHAIGKSRQRRDKVLARIIVFIVPMVILTDLIVVNSVVFREAFQIPPLKIEKNKDFYQVLEFPCYNKEGIDSTSRRYSAWDAPYLAKNGGVWEALETAFLSNIGVIGGAEALPVPRNAIPKGDSAYKGEVFLHNTEGDICISKWSPNRLIITVNTLQKGYVVLNQNYYPGWKVKGDKKYRVESLNGLIAVKVPPGEKKIELYYLPISFMIGLVVTCATILLSIFFVYTERKCKIPESP